MHSRVGRIYLIRNLKNGKGYVGQTTKNSVFLRFNQHRYDSSHGSSLPIHRAMRKWGIEHFVIGEIISCDPLLLNDLERHYVKLYGTLSSTGNGYNRTDGGDGGFRIDGIKVISDEGRKNLSEAHRGNSYAKGYKHSVEARVAMSAAQRNRGPVVISAEQRARISAKLMGHPVSLESREKMSKSHRGVKTGYRRRGPMSDEHKTKIAASMKGKNKRQDSEGDKRYAFN